MIKSYPNIMQSFGLFGLYVLITVLLGVAVASLASYLSSSLLTLIGTVLSMVLILIIALNFKQARISYLFERRASAKPMAYGAAALFVVFLIIFLDPVTSAIPMPEWLEELFSKILERDIFSYLAIGIAAPVLEELLFRKVILEGLEENYGAKKAIIWSALLFAIFHLNPWQGIGAFCAGLLLGWLYVKTRDIWLCIFIHFFNNSLSFLAFLTFDDPFFSVLDITGTNFYSLAAIMGISLVAMYFCYKILKRHFDLQANKPD